MPDTRTRPPPPHPPRTNRYRRTSLIRIAPVTQVITDFCKEIGADGKVRQNLIRTAKQNGGKLGFLA